VSGITNFALAAWVYKQTGSATHFSFFFLVTTLSGLAVAPIAGVFIDRWGRRLAMLVSDFASGLAALGLVLALSFGQLSLWQVYLASAVKSAFGGFGDSQEKSYAKKLSQNR
jgi:MFS transporter, DHA3 family, macrolide efflux protein